MILSYFSDIQNIIRYSDDNTFPQGETYAQCTHLGVSPLTHCKNKEKTLWEDVSKGEDLMVSDSQQNTFFC